MSDRCVSLAGLSLGARSAAVVRGGRAAAKCVGPVIRFHLGNRDVKAEQGRANPRDRGRPVESAALVRIDAALKCEVSTRASLELHVHAIDADRRRSEKACSRGFVHAIDAYEPHLDIWNI